MGGVGLDRDGGMIGAIGLAVAAAGQRRGQAGNPLSFGNVTPSGSYSGQNAPMSRRLAMIGDSRISAVGGGAFASQVVYACGEWVWICLLYTSTSPRDS